MVAGVPPFQANDYASLLRMIVQDEPQTLKQRGAADHALSYIVSRALSKDPMARYASVIQMGMAVMAHNGAVLVRVGQQRLSKRGQKFRRLLGLKRCNMNQINDQKN